MTTARDPPLQKFLTSQPTVSLPTTLLEVHLVVPPSKPDFIIQPDVAGMM